MSADLRIGFERQSDLESLWHFINENATGQVTIDSASSDSGPGNSMAADIVRELVLGFSSTSTISGTLLVVRQWLKTKVVRITVSVGADGGKAIDVTSTSPDAALDRAATVLAQMLEAGEGHERD